MFNTMSEKIMEYGVVPVVVLDRPEDAYPLAKALIEGGLPVAEVTFRTAAAEESIGIIAKEFPEMLLGAGTVLSVDQVKRAVNAGAKFIVCPGFDADIVNYCIDNDIPVYPGVVTPSEAMQAIKCGLEIVKFFPAEQFGGLATVKALAAPFTNLKFLPTGGVSAKTLPDYLNFKKVAACGGSWMVKGDIVKAGDFEKVKALTKEAVEIVKELRG